MWDWIIAIIAFIIVLSLIIIIHEGGHFFFAKKAKILCYEFSLGMGPVIYQKRKGETVYSLRAIPLGGYVSMAGEEIDADLLKGVEKVKLEIVDGRVVKIICNVNNKAYAHLPEYKLISYDLLGTLDAKEDELYIEVELENEEDPRLSERTKFVVARDAILSANDKQSLQIAPANRSFVNKKLGQRFITVFGGPMMNFILAWALFVVIGLIGGYADTSSTILDKVEVDTPAYVAGLKEGDEITKIGSFNDLNEWVDVSTALAYYANGSVEGFDGKINVEYLRDGQTLSTTVEPQVTIYSMELVLKKGLGTPTVGAYVDEDTNKKTIAYTSGLRENDLIVSIKEKHGENKVTTIESINDLLKYFNNYDRPNMSGADIEVTVLRDGETKTYDVTTYSLDLLASQNVPVSKVQIGISPNYRFDLLKLLYMPFVQTGDACMLVFNTLKLLATDKTVNVNDLSGPIGILQIIKSAADQGFITVVNWAAIISVNVGLMNLLPLPALDGGRLAFLAYEGITKKKPSPKVENTIHNIGFILLMLLFVYVAFNDVIRLFFR